VKKALALLPLFALAAGIGVAVSAEGITRVAGPPAWVAAADVAERGRVIVLGFDGLDPGILAEYVEMGALPHVKALIEANGLHDLESELPPESPVAWASLETGVNPARHRVFDFIVRDPRTTGYKPVNGMVDIAPPRFLFDLVPIRPPRITARMAYPTFLERVANAGYPVLALRQPLLFPAPAMPGAHLLSGLGTPDIAGTNGSYAIYDAGFTLGREYTIFNGHRIHLDGGPTARVYDTILEGAFDRRRHESDGGLGRLKVPLRFERDAAGGPVTVTIGDPARPQDVDRIERGRRGRWMRVAFTLPSFPPITLRGRVRFEVKDTDPLVVLSDPVNIDPLDPALPLSYPPGYAAELEKAYGAYKTTGWMEQTFQLNDRNTSPEAFLSDLLGDMDHGAATLLGELRRGASCSFYVFTQTDRATHCFYWLRDKQHPFYDEATARRLGDPLRRIYERMDKIVGDVAATLRPQDLLLVVSDHGFKTWRRGMNVNQWLMNEGYLAAAKDAGEKTLPDFFSDRLAVDAIDWSKSRAYALGLGQIYLNVKGREPEGIVEPGEVDALCREIRTKLLAYADDAAHGGVKPLADVIRLSDVYHGPYLADAAELQLAFAAGYRVSWQTALLGGLSVGGPICEDNTFAWSGDHCSTDRRLVPGVLIASRPMPKAPAGRPYGVKDVAATVLVHFGLDAGDLDGRPLPVPPVR
jgi:predicted AlkP superfamily phosphohydrolase/phosphomutase